MSDWVPEPHTAPDELDKDFEAEPFVAPVEFAKPLVQYARASKAKLFEMARGGIGEPHVADLVDNDLV